MDQNAVVMDQVASGQQLLEALNANGLHAEIAFWAKPTESEKWYLYIACSEVDTLGSRAVYGTVDDVLRGLTGNWLDLLDIKVVGLTDSIAKGAEQIVSHWARRRGMTWFGGSTLGGLPVDGAYFYPPLVQGTPA